MGKKQAKRTVSSGDKVWIVYYRYFAENSFDYDEHGQQLQVFTRREYAKRFIEKLGIDSKPKTINLDGWWLRKYYGYEEHQETEYTLDEMYGQVAPPQMEDETIYEAWTERAAAVIVEVVIDPLYVDPNPCQVINNAEMVSAIDKMGDWGNIADDGVYTICPRCNYCHNHNDNFCPMCGYTLQMEDHTMREAVAE